MKRLFTFLIVLGIIIASGCKNDPDLIKNLKNKEFKKYVESLDVIPLPLKHTPLGKLPELSKNYYKPGFDKFKHVWTAKPLGILYINDKSVTTVELSFGDVGLVPFIVSYDLDGNKIDSLGPYKKSGQDLGYYSIEYLTLSSNRSISVVDTTNRWKLNEDEIDIIEDSLTMTTSNVLYKILDNGEIIEENQ